MNRETALTIARELDRRALLHDSRGDRPLTDDELAVVVDVIIGDDHAVKGGE